MQSILEEFFCGNVSPEVQCFKKDSTEGKVMGIIVRTEEKLLGQLNEGEKELLGTYVDAQMELNQLTAIKSQIYGYKLGLLITAKAFITRGDLITGS